MSLIIRTETTADHTTIYKLIKTAFKTAKVSDGTEQDFYAALKQSPRFIPALALVAEKSNHIIGQIMLTHFDISCNDGTKRVSLLLAPIAVEESYRSQGIGAALMREAVKQAKDQNFESIFLVGDPTYYSRFGFCKTTQFAITNNNDIPDIYVQALELKPDAFKNCAGTIDFNVLA